MARLARVIVPGMPNHVHLIVVPKSKDGLRRAIGEAHRRYTRRINFREQWRGHLWQERFASFVLDKPHLLAALAKNWRRLLSGAATKEQIKAFREHERTGRALGDDDFQKRLEKKLGRVLRRQKPGPKKTG